MVKQVPDSQEVVIDPVTMNLNRSLTRNVTNRADENALEAALQIKDKTDAHVTVVSMGPPQAETTMIECLARGADRAILASDRFFGGADTYPTGLTLAATINAIGKFDIIFAGEETSDSSTGQAWPCAPSDSTPHCLCPGNSSCPAPLANCPAFSGILKGIPH